MKKAMALLLCCIIALGMFAGCGSEPAKDPDTSKSVESPGADEESYVVGYCEYALSNSWTVQAMEEFKNKADQLKADGVVSEYYLTDAGGDNAKQVADMQDLMVKGCDIILLCPGSTEALNATIDEATEDGIVVVTWDSQVSTDSVTAAVTSDQAVYGKLIGNWLGEQLPDGGKVIVLDGVAGASTSQIRSEAAVAAMLAVSPDIEIIAQVNCDWDYATAKAAMEDLLVAHPKIDGVLSQGGAMTQAAMDAFEAAGRDMVPMTGEDNNGFMKTWKKYQADGFTSIAPGIPTYETAVALETAIAAKRGETVDKIVYVEAEPVTDETLDNFIREDLADGYWVHTRLSSEKLVEMFGEGGSAADLG